MGTDQSAICFARNRPAWAGLLVVAILAAMSATAARSDDNAGAWQFEGGEWNKSSGGLTGRADGQSRGFAIADDQPFAFSCRVEAVISPSKRVGASWSAGGVCVYRDLGSYWRLALVEDPEGKIRSAEMLLMNDGKGLGQKELSVVEIDAPAVAWQWNSAYRLSVTLTHERVTGEVYNESGARIWHAVF